MEYALAVLIGLIIGYGLCALVNANNHADELYSGMVIKQLQQKLREIEELANENRILSKAYSKSIKREEKLLERLSQLGDEAGWE